MGNLLNSRCWMGDLTLLEALADGVLDNLNCQHTKEFDQNFERSQMPGGLPERGEGWGAHGRFWN